MAAHRSTPVTIGASDAPVGNGLFDVPFRTRLEQAHRTAADALLNERNVGGWWTGELSPSALSTATAIAALTLVSRSDPLAGDRLQALIRRGYQWLIQHQNADGGWGDTTNSFSNISTTTLVWAAFGLDPEDQPGMAESVSLAERWLARAAGSLEPSRLTRAIEHRYGKDRTFSIPILTMCTLCGRLGPEREGWRHVQQLPFELAALPQRWFGALHLPVVSYALPALIAIGQVRHGMRPTSNSVLRSLRNRCRQRTLDKLARLQPGHGGFLEATPLTSFVTMSLTALGLSAHPVVQRGVSFLETSARSDGSWPIDTNLATWVTTLSVNALTSGTDTAFPDHDARLAVRDWLVMQQGRAVHPYTLSAPGGWAWTDLPGGVPDADDTAGALLALHRLDQNDATVRESARAGVAWLLNLQNRDGGIPTFCRGWGTLPFDRSSPDLTAHAIRAWLAWRIHLLMPVQRTVDVSVARAAQFLTRTQRPDGPWIPLWFGHQEHSSEENPLYGTARVILALCELEQTDTPSISGPLARALQWLIAQQNQDGGWSGASGSASSLEETGLALEALACAWKRRNTAAEFRSTLRTAIEHGASWLIVRLEKGAWHCPVPIGFYFAKLWYHEKLYPLIFAGSALARLSRLR